MNCRCRTYQTGDIEPLQELMAQLGYDLSHAELAENIKMIQKRDGAIFVAESDGRVAGSVCVMVDARLAEGIYAEIVSLVVSSTARGKGIGKTLVKTAELWAEKRVVKVRVRANVMRSDAHSFYQSQGYREIKEQKIFTKLIVNKASNDEQHKD